MAMPVALLIKEGLYVELGLNCSEQEQNHSLGGGGVDSLSQRQKKIKKQTGL